MKRNKRHQVTMAKRFETIKGRAVTVFQSISAARKIDLADRMLDAQFKGYAPVTQIRERSEGDRWTL